MGKEVIFYYDVVCPFAYMASRYVERLGQKTSASIHWRPVLLGGLYEATKAAQGKAGSAMDVMSPAKLKMSVLDLHRQMHRLSVPYHEPVDHPQKTVDAMRLLAAIQDNSLRASVSHALYKAYWFEGCDVSDHGVLETIADQFGLSSSNLLSSDTASKNLRANTAEAAQRGAFGVPSFYTGGRLFWGTDRMFFVERCLGIHDAAPERLVPTPTHPSSAKLTFFFDYASPWSYLAAHRMDEVLKSVAPVSVTVEWVPILVGALFKMIGTPVVPLSVMSDAKRHYMTRDIHDWCEYCGAKINWPDAFPIRSVLPLRLTLAANSNPTLIKAIYAAAWRDNKDIGDKEGIKVHCSVKYCCYSVVHCSYRADQEHMLEVLSKVVYEVDRDKCGVWLEAAESDEVKAQLFANTSRAVEVGVCGVPSFQVNASSEIVWGQDRLNVVADYICGLKYAKL